MAPVVPLLGVMEVDRYSHQFRDVPKLALIWMREAGGFAALGLLIYFIYALLTPSPAVAGGGRKRLISQFQGIVGSLCFLVYLVAIGMSIFVWIDEMQKEAVQGVTQAAPKTAHWLDSYRGWLYSIGSLLAILAFCEPFVVDLFRLRWRRIYALAKLSFKEAIRKRIVWVLFIIFVLVLLFPASWFSHKNFKPEDYLRRQISVMSFTMTLLLTVTALLLSGFSIPSDIKNLTIHTIVTKPVERFEIVVGRFLGYLSLQTFFLVVLTSASLISIFTSNLTPESREESMRSRVPIYGYLNFFKERASDKTLSPFVAIDVGREHSYRRYIAGGPGTPHRAVWTFNDEGELKGLAKLDAVPMEFGFDIYRSTKGPENRGVEVTFDILTANWDPARQEEYVREIRKVFPTYPVNVKPDDDLKSEDQAKNDWKKIDQIAEEFGRYEFVGLPISDYHTFKVMVPPGIFKNAISGKKKDFGVQGLTTDGKVTPGLVQVRIRCDSPSQFVGVAPLDLYFMESEGRSNFAFALNVFKSAIGRWARLAIAIGLAISLSTYLAGVVSFLVALFLFIGGYFIEFIMQLALGANIGGGPFESFTRLVKGSNGLAELEKTPTVQAALFADEMFRWVLRRVVSVIPDTERFDWAEYLEQGFSISGEYIVMNLIFLVGYLLPWAVVSYYLMRSREIAA